MLWEQSAPADNLEPTHRINSPASPTPVADGQRVYVYFGSYGLLCYHLDGRLVWQKPLAAPVVEFGASSSPILVGSRLILNCDQDVGSYLLAVDADSGKTQWKTERPGFPRGFGSPFLWRHDAVEEVVVPGTLWLTSYDVADGSQRWTALGQSRVVCTSPVAGDGLLFAASWTTGGDAANKLTMPAFEAFAAAHDKNQDGLLTRDEFPRGPFLERFSQIDFDKDQVVTPAEWTAMAAIFNRVENKLIAIRPGGHGDITATHLAWSQTRGLPYVPSPLCYRGNVYTVKNGGMVSCFDAQSGDPRFLEERIGAVGDYYASPVAAGDTIYLASQNGVVTAIEATDHLHILSHNPLHETVMASPAVIGDILYLRASERLYAFGLPEP